MNRIQVLLVTSILAAATASYVLAQSTHPTSVSTQVPDQSGLHDFDFLVGEWRVHHRFLSVAAAKEGRDEWIEMEGTLVNKPLAGSLVNVEEHTFKRPTGTTYGIGIRAFDPETATWAIWWIDSRVPHRPMDPPVKGRFQNGVGTFTNEYVEDGKTMRGRFIWSRITATSARWEQATSEDGGKSWKTNWIMELQRASLAMTR
jgi:hypothetical protein